MSPRLGIGIGIGIGIAAAVLALSACSAVPHEQPEHDLAPLVHDALPCPYGMVGNIREGIGEGWSVSELHQSDFGGPTAFPALTKGYPASCVFRFGPPEPAVQAYFIGMGRDFVVEMAKRLKKNGFTVVDTNLGLPDQWSKGAAQVYAVQHFAGDLSIPNTTFDSVFVVITIKEP
jgi:hypothetical protein